MMATCSYMLLVLLPKARCGAVLSAAIGYIICALHTQKRVKPSVGRVRGSGGWLLQIQMEALMQYEASKRCTALPSSVHTQKACSLMHRSEVG